MIKYLLTVDVEIPKRKARSCSVRLRRRLIRIKKDSLKDQASFVYCMILVLFPINEDGRLMVPRSQRMLTALDTMKNRYKIVLV